MNKYFKIINFFICLFHCDGIAQVPLPDLFIGNERFYRSLQSPEDQNTRTLERAKYFIINGNLKRAIIELTSFDQLRKKNIHAYHYLSAWAYHLSGQYELSQFHVERLEAINQYFGGRICSIKLLNLFHLDSSLIGSSFEKCEEVVSKASRESRFWIDNLISKKLGKKPDLAFKLSEILAGPIDQVNLRLKALLLEDPKNIILIEYDEIEDQFLENEKTRELLAINYFRKNEIVEAYKLIYQDKNINAINLNGNILLLKKSLELAFAQYKLALSVNPNSHNAIERIIPISQLLKQWDDTLAYSKRLAMLRPHKKEGYYYQSLSYLNKKDYKKAQQITLEFLSLPKLQYDAGIVDQFLVASLEQSSGDKHSELSQQQCYQFKTYVSCWFHYQGLIWDDYYKNNQQKTEYLWGKQKDYFYNRIIAGQVSDFVDTEIFDQQNIDSAQ